MNFFPPHHFFVASPSIYSSTHSNLALISSTLFIWFCKVINSVLLNPVNTFLNCSFLELSVQMTIFLEIFSHLPFWTIIPSVSYYSFLYLPENVGVPELRSFFYIAMLSHDLMALNTTTILIIPKFIF
jgi:hypothetical protein